MATEAHSASSRGFPRKYNSTILERVVERGPPCKCPPPVFLHELQVHMGACSGQYGIVIMYRMATVHAYSSGMFSAIM